jgi:hypothetical protein
VTKGDLPAGVLPFSKIDGLSDLQALRLPPLARGGAARDEKTKGPFLGRRRISRQEEEEEEEEEGLFKADAVNEEDPERDRATQV